MSRSALISLDIKKKIREDRAKEVFLNCVEEGRRRNPSSVLPLWGADDSFHFNPMLLGNTIKTPYFQKCGEELLDWNAIIDEIYYQVTFLQPTVAGNKSMTSSAFCLLLRLLTLRITPSQMDLTLKHADSPYIRAIGFLYLRFAGPPDQIWKWIGPYIHDHEELKIESRQSSRPVSIGEFVRDLFTSRTFQGTPLPRFPPEIERKIQVKIMQAEKLVERSKLHLKNQSRMALFKTLGSRVMGLYEDEDNPLAWYEAVIDRVLTRDDETGQPLKEPRFVVTFTEYGNTETVGLGELDVLDGAWRRDRLGGGAPPPTNDGRGGHQRDGGGGGGGGGSHFRDHHYSRQQQQHHRGGRDNYNRNQCQDDEQRLYEEVRRRERDSATASKKGRWGPQGGHRNGQQSRFSPSSGTSGIANNNHFRERQQHSPSSVGQNQRAGKQEQQGPPKRTAEELAAISEKKRKLLSKYG